MDNENENLNSSNEDRVEDVDLSGLEVGEYDDVDAIREKAQKATEMAKDISEKNKQLFARTKKAEGFILKDGKWVKPEPVEKKPEVIVPKPEEKKDLTSLDIIALTKTDINEDDIPEVIEYAQFKKISVAEALKSTVVKNLLAEKAEQRKTAEATNTKNVRSGNARVSGESLLEKAQKTGEIPETDEGIKNLVEARFKK